MNGDYLLRQIRRRLRDYEDTNKQGVFWDDAIIRLFLNQAQLVYFNYALLNKKYKTLTHLVRTELINASPTISLDTLQNEYASIIGISFQDPLNPVGTFKTAKHYVAGELGAFVETNHHAAFIYDKQIECRTDVGRVAVKANISYYTYPPLIAIRGYRDINNARDEDRLEYINDTRGFDDEIYNVVIMPLAMVMLGVKDIVTQRETKVLKEYIELNRLIPSMPVVLTKDLDSLTESR